MLMSVVCAFTVSALGMPLVNEGVRWVYAEHHVNVWIAEEYGLPSINEGRLYRYEMRGDTVIDSKTYKKCYCISMSRQPLWDTVGVHCSNEVPAACLRQDGYEVYCRFPDKPEFLLYDFDGPVVVKGYKGSPTPSTYTTIDGYRCAVYVSDWGNDLYIEGIGSVSRYTGDLLHTTFSYATGTIYTQHGMSHVENADGKVIFIGPDYGLYADETDLRGDANSDGVVDIDDVNLAISQMMFCMAQIDYNTWDEKTDAINFVRAADLNSDGFVDIEDINQIINRIVGK